MPYYKTPDNALHFLDSAEFENLLPAGAVQITDEEAQVLLPKPEPQLITKVFMRQARRALLQVGLINQVQDFIDSLPSPQKEAAQIDWEYAGEVERDSDLVKALTIALDLTEEQLDELFALAVTL